jgi:hypothetical protein
MQLDSSKIRGQEGGPDWEKCHALQSHGFLARTRLSVQCQIKVGSELCSNSLNGGGKQVDCRSRCVGVGRREELEEDVHMTGTTSKVSKKQSDSVARIGMEPVWAL